MDLPEPIRKMTYQYYRLSEQTEAVMLQKVQIRQRRRYSSEKPWPASCCAGSRWGVRSRVADHLGGVSVGKIVAGESAYSERLQ